MEIIPSEVLSQLIPQLGISVIFLCLYIYQGKKTDKIIARKDEEILKLNGLLLSSFQNNTVAITEVKNSMENQTKAVENQSRAIDRLTATIDAVLRSTK